MDTSPDDEGLTDQVLRADLSRRGLPTTGTSAELQARLQTALDNEFGLEDWVEGYDQGSQRMHYSNTRTGEVLSSPPDAPFVPSTTKRLSLSEKIKEADRRRPSRAHQQPERGSDDDDGERRAGATHVSSTGPDAT